MKTKRFLFTASLLLLSLAAFSQTTTSAGAWTTGSNWSGGTAPNTSGLSANVIINRAMTFNSGSITGWGSTTITIQSGGSLTVTGDFLLTGSGVNITIQNGGSLSVSGLTTVTNGAKITTAVSGTAGSAILAGLSVTGGGTFTVNSGTDVKVTSLTVSANSNAIVSNAGTLTVGTTAVNGNVNTSGVITNTGAMTVNGNYTQNDAGLNPASTNSGTMNVTGNFYANGRVQLNPGSTPTASTLTVNTLYIDANPWMNVGTNIGACNTVITNYANLVVKTNVNLTGSGDMVVNQNGRVAVFGNITTNGSGNLLTFNCGSQVFVNGNIDITTGGGNTVTNSNSASSPTGTNGVPVTGLYVGGTTTAQNKTGTISAKSYMQTNDLPFYNWVNGLPNSPLPVKLVYFSASHNDDGVEVKWATSLEKNFSHFELERAGTDLKFEMIGQVEGIGSMNALTPYAYVDESTLFGNTYYRLKSIDLDGSYEYSNVVSVTLSNNTDNNFHLYPNPTVNHSFTVELDGGDAVSTIVFSDGTGRVLFEQKLSAVQNEIHLDENILPGIYMAKVNSGMKQKVFRVVVR